MTLASKALSAALKAVQVQRGEVCVYHENESSSVTIQRGVKTKPATQGVDGGENVTVEMRRWDWLIRPDDLVRADGTLIVPAPGHWITLLGTTYIVILGQGDEAAWRWSDPSHTWRRIFTREE
jgi:hypothetical protein